MPRYAAWLAEGMEKRGHNVKVIKPEPCLWKLPAPSSIKKWFGYIDQYLLFPNKLKKIIRSLPDDTFYVLTDHALGPYVPIVKNKRHVVHCHDFLAQRSALGQITENPTSRSGKLYQDFIRRGYMQGKNFISISKRTEEDLKYFMGSHIPVFSTVIYNALNQDFEVLDKTACREEMSKYIRQDFSRGYMLHVGGNQWYKNRTGVIKIYNAMRGKGFNLPLVMVGPKPSEKLLKEYESSVYKADIHLVSNAPDDILKKAYCGATVFVFPSLAEGFGWPIIEAMASGTFVVTTDDTPMSEVAGNSALLLERMPQGELCSDWASTSADKILNVVNNPGAVNNYVGLGLENIKRFNSDTTLDSIEAVYNTLNS